MIAIKH